MVYGARICAMQTLEIGAPKRIRWGLIALVIMGLLCALIVVQFVNAGASDARKKPLDLTTEQAAGKCIGEMQLDRAKIGIVVARVEDFTSAGNNPGQMGVAGKVIVNGSPMAVNCLIDVISGDGSTVTSYRIH